MLARLSALGGILIFLLSATLGSGQDEDGIVGGVMPTRKADGSVQDVDQPPNSKPTPVSGTRKQMSGLSFDPEGADFTAWVNQFSKELYRNWTVPTPMPMGFRGHVDIKFTVKRDGSVVDVGVKKSSGKPALDRAAQDALRGGRFLPLPGDFRPERVTMHVSFLYNEGPSPSPSPSPVP